MPAIEIVARSDREYRVTVGGIHVIARRWADGRWSAVRVGYGLRPPILADTLRESVVAVLNYDPPNWQPSRRLSLVRRIPKEVAR